MKCGFLGFGNMGSAMVNVLLNDGSLSERDVVVYNRSPGRLHCLRAEHPRVSVVTSPAEAAEGADALFICINGPAVLEVTASALKGIGQGAHLISIHGGMAIEALEAIYDGPITKVIPSMTIGTGRGITLMAHGGKVSAWQSDALEALFARSGRVFVLPEEQLGAAMDLTSCGPGLMARMMAELARAGARAGGMDDVMALDMVTETMLGTALMLAGRPRPEELACRVATPGGITERGLRILEDELPGTFGRMFEATRRKREEVRSSLSTGIEGTL